MDGNIAVMGEIDVAQNREFTVAIALGAGHHAALSGLMQTLSTPFELHSKRFVEQWQRVQSRTGSAAGSFDRRREAGAGEPERHPDA